MSGAAGGDKAKRWILRLLRSRRRLMDAVTWLRRRRNGTPARGWVAMIYVGRSGSSVLADLLSQHSRIHWGREVFDNVRSHTPGFESTPAWVRSVIEFRAARKRCDYFGFETQHGHLGPHCIGMEPARYLRTLEDIGFGHFILLTRRNLLRIVISHLVALQTGTLHVAAEVTKATRVRVDPAAPWGAWAGSLTNIMEAYQQFYAELRTLLRARRLLELNYEDDIQAGPAIAYGKVCEFLDIRPEPFAIQRARTNPFTIEQMVSNFDEVCAALRGTRHEWMLTA